MTYGTEPYKLHRSDAPETSVEAAHEVDTNRLEKLVHDTIKAAGDDGLISDEILGAFPSLPYSSVTARYSALDRKGLIARSGAKRRGKSGRNQMVMTAV